MSYQKGYSHARKIEQRKVSVYLDYVDITGYMHDAILFSQIMYWHLPDKNGQSKLRVQHDGYYWIAKHHDGWYEECRIKAPMVRKALKRLQERNLIHYTVTGFGGKKTPLIRVNWDGFEKAMSAHFDTMYQDNMIQCIESNTDTTIQRTTDSPATQESAPVWWKPIHARIIADCKDSGKVPIANGHEDGYLEACTELEERGCIKGHEEEHGYYVLTELGETMVVDRVIDDNCQGCAEGTPTYCPDCGRDITYNHVTQNAACSHCGKHWTALQINASPQRVVCPDCGNRLPVVDGKVFCIKCDKEADVSMAAKIERQRLPITGDESPQQPDRDDLFANKNDPNAPPPTPLHERVEPRIVAEQTIIEDAQTIANGLHGAIAEALQVEPDDVPGELAAMAQRTVPLANAKLEERQRAQAASHTGKGKRKEPDYIYDTIAAIWKAKGSLVGKMKKFFTGSTSKKDGKWYEHRIDPGVTDPLEIAMLFMYCLDRNPEYPPNKLKAETLNAYMEIIRCSTDERMLERLRDRGMVFLQKHVYPQVEKPEPEPEIDEETRKKQAESIEAMLSATADKLDGNN